MPNFDMPNLAQTQRMARQLRRMIRDAGFGPAVCTACAVIIQQELDAIPLEYRPLLLSGLITTLLKTNDISREDLIRSLDELKTPFNDLIAAIMTGNRSQ